MNKNNFVELDLNLEPLVNEYPAINRGGCGFTALYIGEEMEKRGYKVKYILVSGLNDHFDTTLEAVREFTKIELEDKKSIAFINRKGFYIGHIMIYYKGLVIDPTGVCSWENSEWYQTDYTLSAIVSREIIEEWLTQGGWNWSFDRDDLPSIRKRITEIFNESFNQ